MHLSESQKQFLWTLPQPMFVLGGTILMALVCVYEWMDKWILLTLMMWLCIPVIMLGERISPRRKDWWLSRGDLFRDVFWVLSSYLFWIPFFTEYYEGPIQSVFGRLRDSVGFSLSLEAHSIGGLLMMALLATLIIEFIAYWLHRLQHRFLFFWRIHATHHHISKISVGRTNRTHPLEFIGLTLGMAVTVSFLVASTDVIAVILAFKTLSVNVNHANMPLRSGVFGWIFNTAEYHQLHHSKNYAESNRNYGCVVILWDRVFGTFSAKPQIEHAGAGTGQKLPLWKQLALPFFSNRALRKL
ncbi:sterol desaturase family protein [Neiella marina]|uniref:Sterol desaturase family protein n=1 Tax=Neiella holothuriorum TaxID=2870530 RepID=A0ABS7ED92_9GAMM|nr:sterol desaturase family protein [Neiella holothuriorum]MBW8190184.1 sterol desaturase family protein [Neiella holothuriorum]